MKERPEDLGKMYVLRDARTNAAIAQSVTSLNDLAHLTMRALKVPVALIVIDGGTNRWTMRKVGTAVDPDSLAGSEREQTEVAALANPVTAESEGFAFYAATPLRDPVGVRIGTLAILDERSRAVSEDDLVTMRKIAGIVEHLV